MTKRFTAIGECMVEMSPSGLGEFSMGFAGDTFNTAWYLRKLAGSSLEVAYLSAIGDDAPSVAMETLMRDAGIVPELTVRPGGHVGLYMISLKNGERSFSYWRDSSAARTLADDLEKVPALKADDVVFFSGISLAILPEEGRLKLLQVLKDARSNGAKIVFDPNLRPRLWASDTDMCDWVTKGAAVSDVALPSYEDEATFFNDADQTATGNRYLAEGCELVIVKDGPDPVLVMHADKTEGVSPEVVSEIVDTTAAGDAFNAGFLAGLNAGLCTSESVSVGCRLSAQVIGKRGALVEIDTAGLGI
ncbi:MAG: sugar kinase [Pseudoruegeria sp.]